MQTARRIEVHTAEDMLHVCMGTLALSLERMVTRDTVRELETTVKAGAPGERPERGSVARVYGHTGSELGAHGDAGHRARVGDHG